MKIYTTITNIDYYESLKDDAKDGETTWSISKNAKAGDMVLLYVCAPISAIVATAELSGDAFQNKDINSEFYGNYFAEMHNLQMLENPITRQSLMSMYPEWGYWKQPRNSIVVMPNYKDRLHILLSHARAVLIGTV